MQWATESPLDGSKIDDYKCKDHMRRKNARNV